jgi:predicted DNA binding protein
MHNFEARMEIAHDCPFCILTSKYPDSRITSWNNERTYVAIVEADSQGTLDAYEEGLARYITPSHVSRQDRRLELVYPSERRDPLSVTSLIARNDCWHAQPAIAQGGWETYRVFSWDQDNIGRLVQAIRQAGGQVKMLSIHPIGIPSFAADMMVPSQSLFAGLTPKQIDIVVHAVRAGYFDAPARISADELAKKAGLSRSTFTEHLRKAESKLLTNLMPVLALASDSECIQCGPDGRQGE